MLIQQPRIDAKIGFDWDKLPKIQTTIDNKDIPKTEFCFRCENKDYKKISRLGNLTKLWAYRVNQDFLEEISKLNNLEILYINQTTAKKIESLLKLKKLKSLSIIGGTKFNKINHIGKMTWLEGLDLENFKQISDLKPLSMLVNLKGLAIEGNIWTKMKIKSLSPIRNLTNLKYLFLTNLRSEDKSLKPLSNLYKLIILQCTGRWPKKEYEYLHKKLPELKCDWFDKL